jgi:hypothetical protein
MLKQNKRSRRNRSNDPVPSDGSIHELIEEIRALDSPQARRMLHEALESVLEFYGHPHHPRHPHILN